MSPASSPLVGCCSAFEAAPTAGANPAMPTVEPRPLSFGVILFDFGGPPAGRVVGVRDLAGRLIFRTLGRPATVRPDWN